MMAMPIMGGKNKNVGIGIQTVVEQAISKGSQF